jgi:deoxyribose-phosphate aldolase
MPGRSEIARLIDHTLLRATATEEDVRKHCEDAKRYCFASACVGQCYVRLARDLLEGSSVKVDTVVGFPLGANTLESKRFEVLDVTSKGAQEVDFVMNVGLLKSGKFDYVEEEMRALSRVAHQKGALAKVILETCYLTDGEKVRACLLAKAAGVDLVKTSTGLGPGGATVHDVRLMRETVGADVGVKASGGIRTLSSLMAMVQAGASRIGTSSGVQIIEGLE